MLLGLTISGKSSVKPTSRNKGSLNSHADHFRCGVGLPLAQRIQFGPTGVGDENRIPSLSRVHQIGRLEKRPSGGKIW